MGASEGANMKSCLPSILSLVLSALALSACGAMNTPQCRMAGAACAETSDCCDRYICTGNTCQLPGGGGRCGDGKCDSNESTATCCQDCGCGPGLSCQGGTCQPPAGGRCGDGRCDAGENSTNCCTDCGCQAGATCKNNICMSGGGTTSSMMWTIVNNCVDGEDIQYRYFDEVTGSGSAAFVSKQGATFTQGLTCTTGNKVCFGGRQPNHGLTWGVDVDNTRTCSNCCFICADQSVSLPRLTC